MKTSFHRVSWKGTCSRSGDIQRATEWLISVAAMAVAAKKRGRQQIERLLVVRTGTKTRTRSFRERATPIAMNAPSRRTLNRTSTVAAADSNISGAGNVRDRGWMNDEGQGSEAIMLFNLRLEVVADKTILYIYINYLL